jgi:hypothetical protein
MKKLSVGGAQLSTMERSLGNNLREVHDADAVDEILEARPKLPEDKLQYDDEDLIDVDFWEHGVKEPQAPEKDVEKKWKTHAKDWEEAFRALEVKFIKRAIFAHDLKRVYAKKRAELKEAKQREEVSSSAAAAVDKKIESAVKRAKAAKSCGCKTGCPPACGCRSKGLGCSAGCDCLTVNCLNPHTYDNDDAGRAALSAAQDARAKQKLAEAKAKMAQRAEDGHD